MDKFKIFLKELINIITDIAAPLVAVVCAILELVHAPAKAIEAVKQAEYWLFYVCGTAKDIEKLLPDGTQPEQLESPKED